MRLPHCDAELPMRRIWVGRDRPVFVRFGGWHEATRVFSAWGCGFGFAGGGPRGACGGDGGTAKSAGRGAGDLGSGVPGGGIDRGGEGCGDLFELRGKRDWGGECVARGLEYRSSLRFPEGIDACGCPWAGDVAFVLLYAVSALYQRQVCGAGALPVSESAAGVRQPGCAGVAGGGAECGDGIGASGCSDGADHAPCAGIGGRAGG